MNIQFYRKQVYGNTLFYVKDPQQAEAISYLTRQKTLDKVDFIGLKRLGHTFEEVLNPETIQDKQWVNDL